MATIHNLENGRHVIVLDDFTQCLAYGNSYIGYHVIGHPKIKYHSLIEAAARELGVSLSYRDPSSCQWLTFNPTPEISDRAFVNSVLRSSNHPFDSMQGDSLICKNENYYVMFHIGILPETYDFFEKQYATMFTYFGPLGEKLIDDDLAPCSRGNAISCYISQNSFGYELTFLDGNQVIDKGLYEFLLTRFISVDNCRVSHELTPYVRETDVELSTGHTCTYELGYSRGVDSHARFNIFIHDSDSHVSGRVVDTNRGLALHVTYPFIGFDAICRAAVREIAARNNMEFYYDASHTMIESSPGVHRGKIDKNHPFERFFNEDDSYVHGDSVIHRFDENNMMTFTREIERTDPYNKYIRFGVVTFSDGSQSCQYVMEDQRLLIMLHGDYDYKNRRRHVIKSCEKLFQNQLTVAVI